MQKNGNFSKEFSVILNEAFMIRNKSDYDDFYIVSKRETEEQIKKAEIFIEGMENYISTKILK